MNTRTAIYIIGWLLSSLLLAQASSSNLRPISIEKDDNFGGFELLDINDQELFVLAEHWHNIKSVPRATMKVLTYLHQNANVRILAIEQGQSTAHLINKYLSSGDTIVLRQIARNTMFWGQENYAFFQDLYEFNETIPAEERVMVQSIDIEYKMESAIFVINELIAGKTIPESLMETVGTFKQLFDETKTHREQFDGLSVMFYYDKQLVTQLVRYTFNDIQNQEAVYEEFFSDDFLQFVVMILDMDNGLIFDYTNPNTNYKFRDRLIYGKFTELLEDYPDKGILCVIGLRHATKGSSIFNLNTMPTSPLLNKVMNIRISSLYNKSLNSGDLRRINFAFPNQLKTNDATLIKHDPDSALKSKEDFDYTLFINEGGNLTPFRNVYRGEN